MNVVLYAIAWLLPVAAGAAVYLAISPARVPGRICSALGYGTPLGLVLAGVCASVTSRAAIASACWRASPLLLLVLAVAAAIAWRRRQRVAAVEGDEASRQVEAVAPRWQRLLLGVLLATLLARAVVVLREVWLRPLYPWDAWSAWAVKAKTWVLEGHYVPFVSMREWIALPAGDVRTAIAWNYPDALAWIDVWFASAAGGWIEPLVNFAWPGAWIALLVAHFGQWRALGLSRDRALLFVYVLGALPLLTVHAALAGYADLWIALLFALAYLAWSRWLQRRERGQLALAIVCALALPWFKTEGGIWCGALLAAMAFGALPPRWRWRVAIGAVVLVVALLAGGLRWLLVRSGAIDANGAIVDARIGALSLLFEPRLHVAALGGLRRSLFELPNWHLLWWLLPLVVATRWRDLVTREWLFLPALLLLACGGALMYLFLATAAAEWAQSFTAINRLVLHLTPAVVSLAALLLRDGVAPATASGTDRQSAAHSG